MAFLKKGISLLANIGFVLLLLYAIVASPLILGYHPIVVLTGSMEPTYKTGSIIYYKEIPEENLKVGDTITFKTNQEEMITHRINAIHDDKYETKGDANDSPDAEEITYQNILGKVTKVKIPYLGYYIWFINNHRYITILLLGIIVIDFLLEVIKKEKKVSNF